MFDKNRMATHCELSAMLSNKINWSCFETKNRSSHRRCSLRKCALGNFAKYTGKHLCQSLFFERLWHRCFHVNFAKFLRTPFLQNTAGRLLLQK